MIVWIIGLAGSGKTTVGGDVYKKWKSICPSTVLLDGDHIRRIFGQDSSPQAYTVEGRRKNSDRIIDLCLWLDRCDINVVCCIQSIFIDVQLENRTRFSKYLEIYLKAPFEELVTRRPNYQLALNGELANLVGVDIPFPEPPYCDLSFDSGSDGPGVNHISNVIIKNILSSI